MKLNKLLTGLGALALVCGIGSCAKKPQEVSAKLGLGYYTNLYSSYGAPEADFTAAAVVFDAEGKVAGAYLDVVQIKYVGNQEKTGLELSSKAVAKRDDGYTKTKLELGADYNMKGSSAIGKEVNEQIASFVEWTVGKSVTEIEANVDSVSGKPTDATLLQSCSIKVSDFVKAYKVAARESNLKEFKYTEGETWSVKLAMNAGLAYNYGKPSVEVSCDLASVVVKDGKVLANNVDALVCAPKDFDANVTVPAENKYNVNGVWTSKKDLGTKYAMAGKNGGYNAAVTLEWDEQIAIVETAAVGKTSSEISSFVKNEGELVGATITLDSYIKALANASK